MTGGGAAGGPQGHGGGIGYATALLLARQGLAVAIWDIDVERATITAEEIGEVGGTAKAFGVDVTDPSAVLTAADQVIERFGKLDVLVNCVGLTRKGPERQDFLDQDEDSWNFIVRANYYSVLLCTQACLPYILASDAGRIISVSSDAARTGAPGNSVYAGAKAAINAFSKSMALETAAHSVTVNVVSPGLIANNRLVELQSNPDSSTAAQRLVDQQPMGRPGETAEVAATIAFLASEVAAFITGQILSVNGGSAT